MAQRKEGMLEIKKMGIFTGWVAQYWVLDGDQLTSYKYRMVK